MKNSLLNKYTLIFKLTLKSYSPLRIFQILEIEKLKIDQEVLDLGSSKDDRNVSNYIENNHLRSYANLEPSSKDNFYINLEKYPNKIQNKYKNILLLNVLEHIKNTENCFKNLNDLIKKDGKLYGSTPFMFRIHPSPNDYYRFTKQFLDEYLVEMGFKNIKINVLGSGIFCCFYSSIFNITRKIPFLNIFIFFIVIIVDAFLNLFSKNFRLNFPLGYFFEAEKSK